MKRERQQSRYDRLHDLAVSHPQQANAMATIMIWRLLRSIAVVLVVMDLSLAVIAIRLLN